MTLCYSAPMPRTKRAKKKPQRRTPPRRLRPYLLQVCLSEDERDQLHAKLARYDCTAAELVRRWILQQPRQRVAKSKALQSIEDLRQVTVAQHLAAAPSS